MARDIIDDRLIGALHVRAMGKDGFAHDASTEHVAFQTGTLNALMDGRFDGDVTVGELLRHGDHGIGTIQHLAGEMVVVDGEAFVIDASGDVASVADETPTPFAIVFRFSPRSHTDIDGPVRLRDALTTLDGSSDEPLGFGAFRIDGEFADLQLRSVHAQTQPYPPLIEVTRHQTEWHVPAASGTLVGFRFPDATAGIEVPGHHVHFLSDDKSAGGHVLDMTIVNATAALDGGDDLHVELPAGIDLGAPGIADRAAIREAEGR